MTALRPAAALVAALAAAPVAAQDVAAGDAPPPGALSCSGCHAPAGVGGPVPDLTGRAAEEIVAAMRAFRTGARAATVMDRIARGFSDEDTRAIADWLSAAGDGTARAAGP